MLSRVKRFTLIAEGDHAQHYYYELPERLALDPDGGKPVEETLQ